MVFLKVSEGFSTNLQRNRYVSNGKLRSREFFDLKPTPVIRIEAFGDGLGVKKRKLEFKKHPAGASPPYPEKKETL